MARRTTRVRRGGAGGDLRETLGAIDKRFGPVVALGNSKPQPVRISTGSFMLDFCLLGGIPQGRITRLLGHKHAGKTLLADKIISSAQRQFPEQRVVKFDLEGTHDAVWSEMLGVDQDELYVVEPETGEHALDMCEAFINTTGVSLIVVDSLAAITPYKEIDSSAEDQHVGLQSRLIGSFVRKAVSAGLSMKLQGHAPTLLFINQYRSKIGGWSPTGDPLTEPGGKALGHAYSVEITMKNKESKGKDAYEVDTILENEHAFTITKNKCNTGPRSGEFCVRRVPHEEYGLGAGDVDDAGTMLAYAKKFGVYHGGGSSWGLEFWDEEHTFRSAAEAIRHLYSESALKWKLRNFLICEQAQHLGMPDSFLERFYPEAE